MRKSKLFMNQKGFTLTEMLTVIIIVGILSMIAIPKFMSVISKSKITECKPILKQIYTLEQAFFDEHGYYTTDAELLNFDIPKSDYFDYVVTADSLKFEAKAVCKGNIKNAKGEVLNGEWVSINEKEERNSSEKIKKIAMW
jgi:prepilin-type N-terminal cleavage/methylation domain-containing protein